MSSVLRKEADTRAAAGGEPGLEGTCRMWEDAKEAKTVPS